MLLLAVGCGPRPCPTYDSLRPSLERSCYKCHSTSVRGANRQGSPVDANYDDEASLATHIEAIVSRAETKGAQHMPPASSTLPDLTSAEVQALRDYGACH